MPVALDHLGRNRGSFQAKPGAPSFCQLGAEMRKRSHSARELTYSHVFRRTFKSRDIALHFGVPVCEFESEGDRLGMDAVRAADHGCVFEFPSAGSENLGKFLEVGGNNGGR